MNRLKHIFLAAGTIASSIIGLSSCSNDETYDFPGDPNNRVYLHDHSTTFSIIHTPLFSISDFDATIPVRCTQKANSKVSVSFKIDNSLIESYNEEHGTSYSAMPDGVVLFDQQTVTIPAGAMQSEEPIHLTTTDNEELLGSLTQKNGYLVPVVMTDVTGNGTTPSTNMTPVSYFAVTITNDNIHHGAGESDITGTKVSDQSGWSATANVAAFNINYMFDGDVTKYITMQNRNGDVVVTIDMGKEYTFDALTLCYGRKNTWTGAITYSGQLKASIGIETSSNGEIWESVGDWKSGDNNRFMIFYAPITARYVRITSKNTTGIASLMVGEFNIFAL